MAPVSFYRSAAQLGLTRLEVPEQDGGLDLGFDEKLAIFDAITESSMATAFSLINTHNVANDLARKGSAALKQRFLPGLLSGEVLGSTALTEPGAGSDFGSIVTSAEAVDDGWLLNGAKAWITNAARSNVIVCYVQTDPTAGPKGIASFVVDGTRSGFVRSAPEELAGGHGIGAGGFVLDNYLASEDEMFAPPGEGFLAALTGINGARTYVASMCRAMMSSSLGVAVTYGNSRQAFGRSIIEHQGLGWSLADVATQLEATRLVVASAVAAVVAGEQPGGDPRAAILPAAYAKKFAAEVAEPAIAACLQTMGAAGLRDEYPLSRHLAAARIANFVDGSTEMMNERIAASLRS